MHSWEREREREERKPVNIRHWITTHSNSSLSFQDSLEKHDTDPWEANDFLKLCSRWKGMKALLTRRVWTCSLLNTFKYMGMSFLGNPFHKCQEHKFLYNSSIIHNVKCYARTCMLFNKKNIYQVVLKGSYYRSVRIVWLFNYSRIVVANRIRRTFLNYSINCAGANTCNYMYSQILTIYE